MSGSKVSKPLVNATADAGYSGKPLWQKLGLKPGLRVRLHHEPADYWTLCDFDAGNVTLIDESCGAVDFGHLFISTRGELERDVTGFANALEKHGVLWISWPKKSSGVVTEVGEAKLRELVLPLGLVDVKVCAVSAVWSGLKFVWRRAQR